MSDPSPTRRPRWPWGVGVATALGFGALQIGEPPPTRGVDQIMVVRSPLHFPDQPVGHLIVVQPALTAWDFSSPGRLEQALAPYVAAAVAPLPTGSPRLVVLPEYLGTWLVAAGLPDLAYTLPDSTAAMAMLLLSHPLDFTRAWRQRGGSWATGMAGVQRALFIQRAEELRAGLNQALGELARRYQSWIVAAGVLLPFINEDNSFLPETLFNQALFYDSHGHFVAAFQKAFLIREEQPFLDSGHPSRFLAGFTPMGRVGALVCADTWYPESWQALSGAHIVVGGAFLSPGGSWDLPWGGYNPGPAPADVDPTDVGTLTEAQAWERYALIGRLPAQGIPFGALAYFTGQMWEMAAAGDSALLQTREGQLTVTRVGDPHAAAVLVGEVPLPADAVPDGAH